MIALENISVGYDKKEVLHDINLEFKSGKVTILIGPNGCGKSTLLKSLVRINPHMKGRIFINQKEISTYKTIELAKQIAYLSQSKNIPDITVLKMVLHGRFAYLNYPRQYRKEDYQIARNALAWVGLSDLENEFMHRLSGGMRQKVYIAMALAQDTPVILMDEPTTYLDIYHQLKIMDMAKKLADEGKTVIMVLHDLSQALRTADEIVLLHDGIIQVKGTPQEIYERGKLTEVFGIQIEQVKTQNGYHYICDADDFTGLEERRM